MFLDDNKSDQVCSRTVPSQRIVACEQCELHGFLCLLEDMKEVKSNLLATALSRQQPVPKGERLFFSEQQFHAVYAVKSGSFKSYLHPMGADEQVLGFHLPGELIGLESILSSHYGCTTQALEPSSVCQLSVKTLNLSGKHLIMFQQLLIKILARQVIQERRQFLLPSRLTAEERLAAFLINLYERYSERGFEESAFQLPMLRPDIASYLGLAVETVSRTLARFREQRLIEIKGKHIRLLDIPCIRSIAQHCPTL